ncbi:hypothetical protein MOO45_02025 [Bombilactobacillus folatiphilus]|uniref:Uncharacterized protein n=1 Tax=Bombilactobacillus folatiphilus TaxID=2923362 RepID=A0ABY4PA55_9LACO|nr:hypothetical protein [Bombilactobacillus folatiphilus]UQS82485.1 hypothetical protein MOO45_02025 [Bombilactobacillus folatiphilus]
MDKYQTLDLIEQITRNDGSKYYEISNMFMNGRAELAAQRGMIQEVRILELNIPHSTAVQTYEDYVNQTYTFPDEDFDHWDEWDKPAGKIQTAYEQILRANNVN